MILCINYNSLCCKWWKLNSNELLQERQSHISGRSKIIIDLRHSWCQDLKHVFGTLFLHSSFLLTKFGFRLRPVSLQVFPGWLPTASSQLNNSSLKWFIPTEKFHRKLSAIGSNLGLVAISEPITVAMTKGYSESCAWLLWSGEVWPQWPPSPPSHVEWSVLAAKGKQRAVIKRTLRKYAGQCEATLPQSLPPSGS